MKCLRPSTSSREAKKIKVQLTPAADAQSAPGSAPEGNKDAVAKEPSFYKECVALAVRKRIRDAVRARVAVARANRDASDKYHYKQTFEETLNMIKKEDVAITEPKRELDCHASQRGCQDEGSGPSSSKSIP